MIAKQPHHAAETWKYHSWAVMETWIGRGAVNAGTLTNEKLYKAVYDAIDEQCHGYRSGNANWCNWAGYWTNLPTKTVVSGYLSEDKDGNRKIENGRVIDGKPSQVVRR
jgi:hypothetical protein